MLKTPWIHAFVSSKSFEHHLFFRREKSLSEERLLLTIRSSDTSTFCLVCHTKLFSLHPDSGIIGWKKKLR